MAIKRLPKSTSNFVYSKQVIRSSSSVGANYIEANESLGEKDLLMRLRISRKEAKETIFWIRLIMDTNGEEEETTFRPLLDEAIQLNKIFSAIINTCTHRADEKSGTH